jgi:hypothetical protein
MTMLGPDVLARSMTLSEIPDKFGNAWQYHSQSDYHSKVASWGLLFDLLRTCPQLREHASKGRVGFGINHEMRDFKNNRKKDLDLVICTPRDAGGSTTEDQTFAELAARYHLVLSADAVAELAALPALRRVPVGSVHVAVEAKAVMTAHVKALPRLYDELNSSHLAIHGASDFTIAAGLVIVNASPTFVSPALNKARLGRKKPVVTTHNQPKVSERALAKVREIPRRVQQQTEGFDAVGVVMIACPNDGSPVEVVTNSPAPPAGDIFNYGMLVNRIGALYASRFGNV